jgi:hypothetical protein
LAVDFIRHCRMIVAWSLLSNRRCLRSTFMIT